MLSRDHAERYEPRGVEVCISITDPGAAEVPLSPRFAAVLRMQFNDVEARGLCARGYSDEILFGSDHARAIAMFVRRWGHAERIVIHCVAGISRSPAVALGLCDLHGWPTTAIESAKPFWNTLVRRVLKDLDPDSSSSAAG